MLKLLLAPFTILFRVLGINYGQLYAILKVKLAMDNRRSISFSSSKKEPKNQIITQIFLYAFLGVMFVFIMLQIQSVLLSYTIFFSVVMTMLALAIISEFTTLLFDVRDNSILASRPINHQTLAAAKIFHISIYMLIISLSISLAVIIYTLFKFGFLATLLLLSLLILTSFFVLFLTNIFYFVLSNLVNSQRMKDIVVYVQVAMAILLMGAYQLLPRVMDYYDVEHIGDVTLQWWHLLVPPVWMGASLDMITQGIYDLKHLVFLGFTIVIPVVSLILVLRVLSPRFNKASQQQEIHKKKKRTQVVQSKQGWAGWMTRIFTSNQQEAACFKMVWEMSGRERKYKQTVYPVFGYLLIFIAIYVFKGGDFSLETLQLSKRYLVFLYFPMLLLFSLITALNISESSKSSWFFRSMPLNSPGIILRAALKAVFVKYFLPTYFITSSFSLYIWGLNIIDDIVLAFVINLLVAILLQRSLVHDLPFTTEKTAGDMSGNFLKVMLLMISMGVTIGFHYGLTYVDYIVTIAIAPIVILVLILLKSYNKLKWSKIYS